MQMKSFNQILFLFILYFHIDQAILINKKEQCGYNSCNLGKEEFLNVHLIPHTHDDVGWLKTVDQYYYGSQTYIYKGGVQYILDTVIRALQDNPDRRFTYVEMAFFYRWWSNQTPKIRQIVQELVNNGTLQFALGGWSMADEATVHYNDEIDQLTRGRDLLKRLFGQCGMPLVAWQIDPFGHSRDHANIFQNAGFDAVYFQRMDYREKILRRDRAELEVLWDTNIEFKQFGKGLFTGMFYDSYCHPSSFCFDDKCSDEPIRDDRNLEGYNVDERVNAFISLVTGMAKSFKTNHIMILMGCDFTYENAHYNFKNMDKLIEYVNQRKSRGSNVNVFYSTPACYTKAVNDAFNKLNKISRRGGDFFPYASGPNSYWTGYFTSRSALKDYIHKSSNLLTMCEHIHLFADRIHDYINYNTHLQRDDLVDALRKTMGVLQHHDAITGTEKQHVANDYAWRLSKSSKLCKLLIQGSLLQLLPSLTPYIDKPDVTFCDLKNISLCELTENQKPYLNQINEGGIFILLYNSLGWDLTNSWIRIPIYWNQDKSDLKQFIIKDLNAHNYKYEIHEFQLIPITKRTLTIPERETSKHKANYELIFNAPSSGSKLLRLGFSLFYFAIQSKSFDDNENMNDIDNNNNNNNNNDNNNIYHNYGHHVKFNHIPDESLKKIHFITKNIKIELINNELNTDLPIVLFEHLKTGIKVFLNIELLYYIGEDHHPQPSGAYVFSPKYGTVIQRFAKPSVKYYTGPCVQEAHIHYKSWATLVVRLYNNGELHTEWTVGPLSEEKGRELVIRYTLLSENLTVNEPGEFYTDSGGRHLIKRIRNQRIDWNLPTQFIETEPISGNYYPIINRIMLRNLKMLSSNKNDDLKMGLAIYTDRAQGATSLSDGEIEIMLHRLTRYDDGYGVQEALREKGMDKQGLIVRGNHYIRFDELHTIDNEDENMAQKINRPIIPLFMSAKLQPPVNNITSWTGLNIQLPDYIHLLTLTSWPLNRITVDQNTPNQILVRFEYLLTDQKISNKTYELNLNSLFNGIIITKVTQVSLTADQNEQVMNENRLKWPTEINSTHKFSFFHSNNFIKDWQLFSWSLFTKQQTIIKLKEGEISTFILDYEQ